MYCKYTYFAGSTPANILSDITALLAGETDLANLSANCDIVNSELLTTIPAGWSVHDDAASASSKVLKAPHFDAGFGDKYVELSVPNATDLFLYGYSAWNEVTHVGQNKTANGTTSDQKISTSTGGVLYICASARFIYIGAMITGVFGDSGKSALLIAEFYPIQPWHVPASGVPAFVLAQGLTFSGAKLLWFPKIKNKTGELLTGTAACAYFMSIGVSYNDFTNSLHFPTGSNSKVINASGGFDCPRYPLYVGDASVYSAPIGDISQASGIWLAPAGLIAHDETINIGGVEYVGLLAYQTTNDLIFLIRKG